MGTRHPSGMDPALQAGDRVMRGMGAGCSLGVELLSVERHTGSMGSRTEAGAQVEAQR